MIDGEPRFATCRHDAGDDASRVLTRDNMAKIILEQPQLGSKILVKLVADALGAAAPDEREADALHGRRSASAVSAIAIARLSRTALFVHRGARIAPRFPPRTS